MTTPSGDRLPPWIRAFPGAVLQLSADGAVLQSNGVLEPALGVAVVGREFVELLDAGPTRAKWDRMVAQGPTAGAEPWELILCGEAGPLEPRRFSVLPDPGTRTTWLVEHPPDARLDAIRTAVLEVNSALVQTQRELVQERGRLSAALAELARSNRALDEFAHAVSHDLRAPLRGISYYAQWIEEDLGEAARPAAAHLAELRAQVARLQRMIEGVLRFARAGRLEARPEQVDIRALITEALEILAPPPTATIRLAEDLPTVETERAPLLQIFLNLVGNAIKHGGAAVTVEVSAVERAGLVEFAVADDGPGIPQAMRERLWGLFATGASGAEEAGTGIGLAVVKRLVEDRGGRAWIEDAPGGGATFRFTWVKQSRRGAASGG